MLLLGRDLIASADHGLYRASGCAEFFAELLDMGIHDSVTSVKINSPYQIQKFVSSEDPLTVFQEGF